MNTLTLSQSALTTIDQYRHFKIGTAVCSVPYFNNKTIGQRMALRVNIGKGSPKDIFEETESFLIKNHIPHSALSDESLKEILVDNNLGIECSGFVYQVLNIENHELGKGSLDRHLTFVNCRGIVGKIRCSLRPIENCDVSTFAHDKNSRPIIIKETKPGDIITMTSGQEGNERDHILLIHQIEYQNSVPTKIHYTHAVAYPEDGQYGTGIKQGLIEILKSDGSITEQQWTENSNANLANQIFNRAQKSKTEIRRLKWL